jgi:hypothetical protein
MQELLLLLMSRDRLTFVLNGLAICDNSLLGQGFGDCFLSLAISCALLNLFLKSLRVDGPVLLFSSTAIFHRILGWCPLLWEHAS